jgi:hypothetical protein
MNKFKVGDIIKGTSDNFGMTNTHMKRGEIIDIGSDAFKIKILEHDACCYNGRTYVVNNSNLDYFEFVENIPNHAKILGLRIGENYKIDDFIHNPYTVDDSYLLRRPDGDLVPTNCYLELINNPEMLHLIEKPVKEMTVADIEKALGYSVKIIGEDK